MSDKPVFEIVRPDRHVYKIYANGDVEGFEVGVIINRLPTLLQQEFLRGVKYAEEQNRPVTDK